MITGLLQYSLERVSSLEHFYNEEYKSIETKSRKGTKNNKIGYFADLYLSFLASNPSEEEFGEFKWLKEYVNKYLIIEKESTDKNMTRFRYKYIDKEGLKKQGYELDITKAAEAYRKYSDMPVIHGSNTLIMLITRFEEFISNLISKMYLLYPQKYLDKQQISFSEIACCGVDEIRKKIVYREVDAIMRQSYTEWFKLFESHGFKFDSCKKELESLKEIYARRNILVHNAGVVNDIYLKNVPKSTAKKDERLYATNSYLKEAFQTIRVIIFTVMLEAVRFVKEDKDAYLYSIFEIAFELLKDKQYVLSKHVFSALKNHKDATDDTRKLSQVNYWLSVKGISGAKSILDEVGDFDVSALNRRFLLAKLILLEEYGKATILISDMYKKEEIGVSALRDWPLFEDYRMTEEYKEFKTEHQSDFTTAEIEIDTKGTDPTDERSDDCDCDENAG